jgi:hypothetical protein
MGPKALSPNLGERARSYGKEEGAMDRGVARGSIDALERPLRRRTQQIAHLPLAVAAIPSRTSQGSNRERDPSDGASPDRTPRPRARSRGAEPGIRRRHLASRIVRCRSVRRCLAGSWGVSRSAPTPSQSDRDVSRSGHRGAGAPIEFPPSAPRSSPPRREARSAQDGVQRGGVTCKNLAALILAARRAVAWSGTRGRNFKAVCGRRILAI